MISSNHSLSKVRKDVVSPFRKVQNELTWIDTFRSTCILHARNNSRLGGRAGSEDTIESKGSHDARLQQAIDPRPRHTRRSRPSTSDSAGFDDDGKGCCVGEERSYVAGASGTSWLEDRKDLELVASYTKYH